MGAVVDTATPGPLVGRGAELRTLADAIGRAADGRTQVVAITGEAGIGKSRLAREALRLAGTRGFRTLESAAGRLHRDLSYAPIVDALRPLVAEAALVDGLSDLARLFYGLRVPPLVALGDPGLERTRMFEAVRALIERASIRPPLAILIDDLHWADPGTSRCCTMWCVPCPGNAACSSSRTASTRSTRSCASWSRRCSAPRR